MSNQQKNFRRVRQAASGSLDHNQRGLPSHDDLIDLANSFIEQQRALWGSRQDCPWVTAELSMDVDAMVQLSVQAHTSDQAADLGPSNASCNYGSAYLRFSDENNNPRSLAQQLFNVLERAAKDGVWISFKRVFADAAISGRTSARPGFQLAKNTMANPKELASVLYVDDLSRLSRDEADMLGFAKALRFAEKQMIGVSDGFDSSNPMASFVLPLNAVQHSEFSRNLRAKVVRGARDAFLQERNTGAVPFGYKPFAVLDDNGQPVIKRKGKVETEVRIVPEEAAQVVRMFELYTNELKSPTQIAKIFNQELVGGRNSWGNTSVAGMLKNDRYRGLIVYNRTQHLQDPDTGRKIVRKRPEHEWMTRQDESMRIISDDLWERTQARREQVSVPFGNGITGSKPSRHSAYPTRLFEMYCGYCNLPLRKNRTGEKTSSMICPSGAIGQYGCKLTSSKTLSIIEECIWAHVKERLLDEVKLDQFVADANRYIAELANQPRPKVGQIDRKIQTAQEKLNRAVDRLMALPDGPSADRAQHHVSQMETELLALREERKAAVALNTAVKPLPAVFAKLALSNLRSLLNEDVIAAHKVLAKAIGVVSMTIGQKQGRSNVWIAKFKLDMVPFLIEISTRGKIPTTHTLELLSVRSWNLPDEIESKVFELKREVRLADQVAKAIASGISLNTLVSKLKVDKRTIQAALEFQKQYPDEARRYASNEARKQFKDAKRRQLAPEVGRLFQEGMSLNQIAKHLLMTPNTVRHAFDEWNSEAIDKAIAEGKEVCRSSRPILPAKVYAAIRKRLKRGESIRRIASEMHVDRTTVRRQKKLMESEQGSDAA